jgi:hypothetical protein
MNSMQTAWQLSQAMNKYIQNPITDSGTLTILSLSNQNVAFTTTLPYGTANQAQLGVMEITSGKMLGMRSIVATHAANDIGCVLIEPLRGEYAPAPGDTCHIYGGPLLSTGETKVFFLDKDTVAGDTELFQVTTYIDSAKRNIGRLNGAQLAGLAAFGKESKIEIMVESPLVTGSNTASYRSAALDLYTLTDQIEAVVCMFLMDGVNNFTTIGDVETNFYSAMQSTGDQYARQVAIISISPANNG